MILLFVLALTRPAGPAPSPRPAPVPSPTARPRFRVPVVVVHRAYVCPSSRSWKAKRGNKLVAIDLDFQNIDSGLDLDDVELLDASSGRVLEAAPEAAFLEPDGRFHAWRHPPPSGIRRVLLVFEVPARVRAVRVQLWDDILTPSPITFAPRGPSLPPERPGA